VRESEKMEAGVGRECKREREWGRGIFTGQCV